MTAESIYRYTPEHALIPTGKPETHLLVADSWLTENGYTRALHLHRERFASSCNQLAGIRENDIIPFWEKAIATIPETGQWFPRIELAGSSRKPVFQFRIRKAPPLHLTIRLIACRIPDFRKKPRHKGPDLDKAVMIRKNILETGAEEGILTTPEGFILEGLTTSILWWEDGTLCTVPPSYRILPGITSRLVQTIAIRGNIPVACRRKKLQDLNHHEVWAVNALHGIRRAIDWEHSPFTTSVQTDIDSWRKALDNFNEKI